MHTTLIPLLFIAFTVITVAELCLGGCFLFASNSIYERDQRFAVAGRYLLGFGGIQFIVLAFGAFTAFLG